ncbi:MAG: MBL fold metallo-hydrolase [candidate division NC10 bacterium]|nr:MBL fold metallo-hydrolase [candidate division NC10 bacterium]
MLEYAGIQITWLGHDGFKLKKGTVIYVDPYQLGPKAEPADLVFVTHEHFDHLSLDDLKKVVTPRTTVVTIAACEKAAKGLTPKAVRIVSPGDRLDVEGVAVEVLPAYNTNKFRSAGKPFHPKADGKVGYILGIGGVRIYHAGDTDEVPEMAKAKGVDVALLPVSGTYVMTAQEAIQACEAIQPKMAIPMHYGAIVGSAADAEAFRKGLKCRVEILMAEP